MILGTDAYRSMIAEIEDCAILFLDTNCNILNWNKGAEKIKGYSAKEVVGKNFNLLYTEEDREKKKPENTLKLAMENGKVADEGWSIRKDNTLFWESNFITAIHDNSNDVIGFTKITRDLTEKKHTQELKKVLAETKEGLLTIFNLSPVSMSITDIESWKLVDVNNSFLTTFGYTREEMMGSSTVDLGILTKERREKLRSKLKQYGGYKNEVIKYFNRQGIESTFMATGELFELEGKQCFLSIFYDISERLKAEEAERVLARTQEGLLKMFNASPSGMIITDIESGRLQDINESFVKTFGYTREEAIGLRADELGLVSKETQEISFGKLKTLGSLKNEDVLCITKTGKKIDTIFSVELFEMDGRQCFLCIFHDITEIKGIEKKLIESENKYRNIIEEAGDVLYTTNAQGKFTYINKRIKVLTGYTDEELLGKHFSTMVAPEWQVKVRDSYRDQYKHKSHETIMEFVIITKSGEEKWVEQVVVIQLEDEFIKGFQCIVRDITERKKVNLLLTEQKQIIEQKNRDILDSINYAKRIQDAIFPPEDLIKELLPESFILFRPKDIISGDFYWVEKFENKTYIAAVDCTGHGVPGALLSIVGYNLLSKSINDHQYSEPNEILNELSYGTNKTLRQTIEGSGVKDTMDIALCSLDRSTNMLEFAGAYNSLYLIRNNKLTEIPADRFPIGVSFVGDLQKFTNQQMQLEKGDMIYLFSDGYPDQFGGPRGKKLKHAGFKEILLSISNLPG